LALLAGSGVAVVIVGFFALQFLVDSEPEPLPPPVRKAPAATTPTPATSAGSATAQAPESTPKAGATPGPTPSATLNDLARAPKSAIDRAQAAIAARSAGGQSNVEPVLDADDVANRPAGAATTVAPRTTITTATTVAPG